MKENSNAIIGNAYGRAIEATYFFRTVFIATFIRAYAKYLKKR